MDDYREQLIELVSARPLLWDPRVADYKDKDQKAQVWENLNGRLNSPTGKCLLFSGVCACVFV